VSGPATAIQRTGGSALTAKGFFLDQTLEFDLTEPDPIPEYEFDQSIPDDFDS
jgi:hypothetical protein